MRTMLCTALCVLLAAVALGAATLEYDPGDKAQVALVEKIEALQASAWEDSLADMALDTRDVVQAALPDSVWDRLRTFGLVILADTQDPVWVKVAFPLEGSTGFERVFITDRIAAIVQAGGQDMGDGMTRLRKDTAVDALQRLSELLPNRD